MFIYFHRVKINDSIFGLIWRRFAKYPNKDFFQTIGFHPFFFTYPCKQKLKDFDIRLKDHKTREVLTKFTFSGATLVSENYTVNTDENAKISATYKSYISDLQTLNNNMNTNELKTETS